MAIKEELIVTLVGICVTGTAYCYLWGGGEGCITMKPQTLKPEMATKDNILRCVNDGGFGVEAIYKAEIDLIALYSNGGKVYLHSFETDCPVHRKLFLGWKILTEKQAWA